MSHRLGNHIKKLILPCIAFSALTGVISAIFITAFKIATEYAVHYSTLLYGMVRSNPNLLPILIIGCSLLGLGASLILFHSKDCRGGGIPTSIAAIRGIVSFNWIKGILLLPFSALITFLSGVPLGTEGPCVQMGTAVGDGVSKCFAKRKQRGWRRYTMVGGAAAGFSIATGAPISSVIFSMEELHKKMSPLLLTVASISVIFAQLTAGLFESFGIGSVQMFHISSLDAMELRYMFVPLLIGLVCGATSILFTRLYHLIDKFMRYLSKKIPIMVLFPIIFALVAVIGFFISDAIGSGHGLIDALLHTQERWYLLLLVFLLRMVAMMVSSTSGVTGGIFLPTLAFGAIIGSVCADILIASGLMPAEFYTLTVVLGITAFLGSTSRIPITACIFAVEALGGINNILPIIIVTIAALITVNLSGLEDFTDAVVKSKADAIHQGKEASVIEVSLRVNKNAFVIGKELHDILWPNACSIISFEHTQNNRHVKEISEGDVISLHYTTYDPPVTADELIALVGEQDFETERIMKAEK